MYLCIAYYNRLFPMLIISYNQILKYQYFIIIKNYYSINISFRYVLYRYTCLFIYLYYIYI